MMLNIVESVTVFLSFSFLMRIEEEACMVQELLALTEAAQIFEQIPLVAVGKMRGVDWTIITVSFPCFLLPTDHCSDRQH